MTISNLLSLKISTGHKTICYYFKQNSAGWDYVKWYDNSTNLIPGYTKPLVLIAQQCSDIHGFKLEVAVILMISLVDYSKTALDILNLHSTIKSVERNRDSFLKELSCEHKSLPNCDIYDCKTTSFRYWRFTKIPNIKGELRWLVSTQLCINSLTSMKRFLLLF
ncbi:hypothetical protein MN116_004236 [Schistosoma mekongi]|uniref:Uncharacterized protein n=1 Tax=Schistosoma mekongi TaxID=38744 RepID=A0AAE1ZGB4_SCHME|nr:hypothetical protein MN116_004236 [Schistosoma mekongi]